jgi:hypothetical protein
MAPNTKMKIFKGYWTIYDVIKSPNCLFLFGDNDAEFGKLGQAVIRDCSNSAGIPTKKYPSNHPNSFYTDAEYETNKKNIDTAIRKILDRAPTFEYVIFPENGFGTGLSDLHNKAPKTNAYLGSAVAKMIDSL